MRILYLPNEYSQQRQKEKPSHIYPVRMAMECAKYCKEGHEVYWGKEPLDLVALPSGGVACKSILMDKIITESENLPFLTLPRPDRVFTRAKEYTSGNYKYLPGTHILSASGCWWGKCKFCVENQEVFQYKVQQTRDWVTVGKTPDFHKPYEVRPVEEVIQEIKECKSLGFKEVFDDSATFPQGVWLERFLEAGRIRDGFGVTLGCNCRVAAYPFVEMFHIGFRMLLFGIESANQKTLDKINKGVKSEDIIPVLKKAAAAGLEPHVAVMFGFPWETDAEALNTLRLVHYLLRKGYAKTAQASFYCPEKTTPAGQENQKGQEHHRKYIPKIYDVYKYPDFWWTTIRDIKNKHDLEYLWRKIKNGLNRNRSQK